MVVYSGYMISVDSMKRWLFWIVSPRSRVSLNYAHLLAVLCQSSFVWYCALLLLSRWCSLTVMIRSLGWFNGKRIYADFSALSPPISKHPMLTEFVAAHLRWQLCYPTEYTRSARTVSVSVFSNTSPVMP